MPILHSRFVAATLPLIACAAAHADRCFQAKGELGADAQEIRQQAAEMGWIVGKPASLTASSVVKSKVALYTKGIVKVCLQVDDKGKLALKIQAGSSDARKAVWHKVPAKKS